MMKNPNSVEPCRILQNSLDFGIPNSDTTWVRPHSHIVIINLECKLFRKYRALTWFYFSKNFFSSRIFTYMQLRNLATRQSQCKNNFVSIRPIQILDQLCNIELVNLLCNNRDQCGICCRLHRSVNRFSIWQFEHFGKMKTLFFIDAKYV